ncbi:hypothetical protein L202_05860 [Cryptococcus amylolentus CBS 6039]|uniref:Uncharacterized protein n=1 Tax=Cryptococcus amylolentus CBS 6039 TaxID=1295533 RepID=A0A1E3HHP3_9TREE|nr:hypothetical protein L202_05860 [Cryptococcus amylolentus CBS 6039]ODN75872.1 hypothetical protein L202_05860 [Cryptococcus amylolentus CBS 6039]
MQDAPQRRTQETEMASIPTEGRPVVPVEVEQGITPCPPAVLNSIAAVSQAFIQARTEWRYMYCLREWFAFVQENTLVSPRNAAAFMWERVFVKTSHSYRSTILTVDQLDADGDGERKRASKK